MNICDHAHERLCQRLAKMTREQALDLLKQLWHVGREATFPDLRAFDTIPMSDARQYRIVTYKHRRWLIVFDTTNSTFVTIWSQQ